MKNERGRMLEHPAPFTTKNETLTKGFSPMSIGKNYHAPSMKSTHESITGDSGGMYSVTRRLAMNAIFSTAAITAVAPAIALSQPQDDGVDHAAVLARAERVVELLRTCVVCDGWKIDEEAAERTLQYFRSQAAGQPDNDEEWQAAIDFIGSHGQSLDWILLGEPGCMICGGASNSDRARSNAHNDSVLLALEEQIFEVREAAHAHDEEIFRLCEVWRSEIHRLHNEICAGRLELTYREAWDRVSEMPESKEHDRLVGLGEPHHAKKDQLIEEMWATPALTSEGRRSKVLVLLGCIMGQNDDDGWQEHDGSYLISPEAELARKLLIEFVGGEPGESLRDQFRASAA